MAQDLRAAEHGPIPHWKKGFKTPVFLTQIAIDLLKTLFLAGPSRPPGKRPHGILIVYTDFEICPFSMAPSMWLFGANPKFAGQIGVVWAVFLAALLCLTL